MMLTEREREIENKIARLIVEKQELLSTIQQLREERDKYRMEAMLRKFKCIKCGNMFSADQHLLFCEKCCAPEQEDTHE